MIILLQRVFHDEPITTWLWSIASYDNYHIMAVTQISNRIWRKKQSERLTSINWSRDEVIISKTHKERRPNKEQRSTRHLRTHTRPAAIRHGKRNDREVPTRQRSGYSFWVIGDDDDDGRVHRALSGWPWDYVVSVSGRGVVDAFKLLRRPRSTFCLAKAFLRGQHTPGNRMRCPVFTLSDVPLTPARFWILAGLWAWFGTRRGSCWWCVTMLFSEEINYKEWPSRDI